MKDSNRIESLSRSESVARIIASTHCEASEADALRDALAMVSNLESASIHERNILTRAIVEAHRRNALRYRIAVAG